MFPLGQLPPIRPRSPLANQQLTAWEEIARRWELREVTETHLRCAECGQSVIPDTFDGKRFTYADDTRLALIVAHLRQAHMDLDPDHD